MEYLKLGSKASIFYDPSSLLLIRNDEVIAVERKPKTKMFSQAFSAGHITSATEKEYKAWIAKNGKTAEVFVPPTKSPKKDEKEPEFLDDYEYNPEFLEMTPEELMARIKNEGFMKEDMARFEGLTDVKAIIKLFDEINKEYTS